MNEADELRLEELFQAALEVQLDQRRAFVASACAGRRELENELITLLDAHQRSSSGVLAGTAWDVRGRSARNEECIGPYRVVRTLGSGGMGTVLLAERIDGAFARQVAIKVVQLGATVWDSKRRDELERRFVEERQVLAVLDHPGIARLFDGGTTDDGRPYFVMEYVDGIAIDRFCRERELDLPARLDLFREVCAAVQYAHQKLVAHRDIKPANILVESGARDLAPRPKLLDFGIAKMLAVGAQEAALRTTIGSMRLTPAYASPEQFRGEPATVASDVYSLGVVLYELITGRLPYSAPLNSPDAVLHAVCNESPLQPSRFDRRWGGDLETVVLKALEKDPSRRYASAAALEEDLRRYRTGHPIHARRPTVRYRLTRALHRHRRGAAAAAVALITTFAFATWSFVLRGVSVEARESADRERANALRATELFRQIFAAPDPFERFGKDVTVAQVLDQVAPSVLDGLGPNDEVRLELSSIIADTYQALGVPAKAVEYARDASATSQRVFGDENPKTLGARARLARALLGIGDNAAAEEQARAALDAAKGVLNEDELLLIELRETWCRTLREIGEDEHAEVIARELVGQSRRVRGENDPHTIEHIVDLSSILIDHSEYAEAEELLRGTLATVPDGVRELRQGTLAMRFNLGFLLMRTGRTRDARAILEAVHTARVDLLGEEHVDTLGTLDCLAELELTEGRPVDAESLARRALEARTRIQGAEHPETLACVITLASALAEQGRLDDAERELQRALETARGAHGDSNYITIALSGHLGLLLMSLGLLHEAETLQRELVAVADGTRASDDPLRSQTRNNLAQTLAGLGKFDEAVELQRWVVDFDRRSLGEAHPQLVVEIANLGAILRKSGNTSAAEVAYAESVRLGEEALGENNTLVGGCHEGYARNAELAGRFEDAECHYLRAHDIYERVVGASHPGTQAQLEAIAAMWERVGDSRRAAEFRGRAAE